MCQIYLGLDLASPEYVIKSGVTAGTDNSNFKYEIQNPVLRLKRVKTLDSFTASFEKRLLQKNALFPHDHISARSYVIPAGLKNFSVQDLFGSTFLPKSCYLMISSQTASAGSFSSTPLSFQPWGVKEIALYAQNERIPSLPFQLDYSGDSPNFLRAFAALFGNDSLMKDSTCGLDRTRFGTYFNIFSFWMTRVKIKGKIFWVVVVTRRENEFLSIEEANVANT